MFDNEVVRRGNVPPSNLPVEDYFGSFDTLHILAAALEEVDMPRSLAVCTPLSR
jgi:hypothetical protein